MTEGTDRRPPTSPKPALAQCVGSRAGLAHEGKPHLGKSHEGKSRVGVPLIAVPLVAALCLGYFHVLDRVGLSTAGLAPIFKRLLLQYDARAAVWSVVIGLAAILWRSSRPIEWVIDRMARYPLAAAGMAIMVAVLLNHVVYHGYPLCMDEYAAVFQAKLFAAGRLYASFPPAMLDWLVLPGFNGSFFVASHETGRVIEGYWPGFALLLAPFEWLALPGLCNALLAGIALYLIYTLTVEITSDRAAGAWAMLLALASGVFWAYAVSLYAMQAHLTLNLLFAWLLTRPTPRRLWIAGGVGSIALVLHNPFPHVLFALPWLAALWLDEGTRRRLPYLLLGYAPVALGVGLGWLHLRSMLVPPQAASTLAGITHGVFRWPTEIMLNMRIAGFVKLCVWAVPGLLVFAAVGGLRHGRHRTARLLAVSAVLTFMAYLFVDLDQGHGWGNRYFHSAWGVLPILAGCALTRGGDRPSRNVSFAGALACLSLLLLVPLQMAQIEGFIAQRLEKIPPAHRPGNDVYFVDWRHGFYTTDFVQVDPLLRDPDLVLASRGAAADEALIRDRWPQAQRFEAPRFGAQWYLGTAEQRVGYEGGSLHWEWPVPGVSPLAQ